MVKNFGYGYLLELYLKIGFLIELLFFLQGKGAFLN